MQNLPKTILMPIVVISIVTITIIIIALTAPRAENTGEQERSMQSLSERTNSSTNLVIKPAQLDVSFYVGFMVGSSFTLIGTFVFFMVKDQLDRRRRAIEEEKIRQERDRLRMQLNKKMRFLSGRFRETAEVVTESRRVSDMLLLRENGE